MDGPSGLRCTGGDLRRRPVKAAIPLIAFDLSSCSLSNILYNILMSFALPVL